MLLVDAFRKVHHHITLILFPILYDLLAFVIGWSIVGMDGKERTSIRLILEMGLPSASHVSNIPLFANNIDFLNSPNLAVYTWLIVIIMIVMGAFLQGGYIHYMYSIVSGKNFNLSQFFHAGKKSWLQFIFLGIILFFGKIAVTSFLVLMFNMIGIFAALVFFICLRILFIYLEFTIVVDRVSITAALKLSRGYLKNSLFVSFTLIFIMYITSSLISFLIHWFWGPLMMAGSVFAYGYVMSVVQTLFMTILCRTRNKLTNGVKAA